ncbi:MAG: hypothetical protein ABSD49_09075 [Candidatus Bathyarchaeia archaeon]|jgi:hypothetical protein
MRYYLLLLTILMLGTVPPGVTVNNGISLHALPGYYTYNLDPTLTSSSVGPIYDPNFIPGFQVGLTNTSISWEMGEGYARIGYSVGPWEHLQVQLPHLAVGPQCCNFNEIPRTQQYRRPDWGDYNYVRAGFLPPAVNVANYTTDFTAPAYVGLRTDWDWTVSVSLNWTTPSFFRNDNRWVALGLAATQYVPSAPKKLVYTVVNFWMDQNSSNVLNLSDATAYAVVSSNVVVYHPTQISGTGNMTILVHLSPYLDDTLRILGLQTSQASPPVISYLYLNIEGYNFHWNGTIYSMFVMSNHAPNEESVGFLQVSIPIVSLAAALTVYMIWRRARTLKRSVN